MTDKDKVNELVASCGKALRKMGENRAKVQEDVKNIIVTFCSLSTKDNLFKRKK